MDRPNALNRPPQAHWEHLEKGLAHFNTLNAELKDYFPAEHNAINGHLALMSKIFCSAAQRMEADATLNPVMFGAPRVAAPVPFVSQVPQGNEYGVIGTSVPGRSPMYLPGTSLRGVAHSRVGGTPPAPPGIPIHGGAHGRIGGTPPVMPAMPLRPNTPMGGFMRPGVNPLLANSATIPRGGQGVNTHRFDPQVAVSNLPSEHNPQSLIIAHRNQVALDAQSQIQREPTIAERHQLESMRERMRLEDSLRRQELANQREEERNLAAQRAEHGVQSQNNTNSNISHWYSSENGSLHPVYRDTRISMIAGHVTGTGPTATPNNILLRDLRVNNVPAQPIQAGGQAESMHATQFVNSNGASSAHQGGGLFQSMRTGQFNNPSRASAANQGNGLLRSMLQSLHATHFGNSNAAPSSTQGGGHVESRYASQFSSSNGASRSDNRIVTPVGSSIGASSNQGGIVTSQYDVAPVGSSNGTSFSSQVGGSYQDSHVPRVEGSNGAPSSERPPYSRAGAPLVTVQPPTPILAPTPMEAEIYQPAFRSNNNLKAESMAERLARIHEEEERLSIETAQIPVKSSMNSWAGIAVKGVGEVEKKGINMRVRVEPQPEPVARSFTTIGRAKPKSIDVKAANAQTALHNDLFNKFTALQAAEHELRLAATAGAEQGHASSTQTLPIQHGLPAPAGVEEDHTQTVPDTGLESTATAAKVETHTKKQPESPIVKRARPFVSNRNEAAADQQRVAYLLNPTKGMTIHEVSEGIKEGALVAIRPGTDNTNGQLFYCIVFQFAPCLTNFLKVMEDERLNSRPKRYGFIANVVRGGDPYPRDAILQAMDEPHYARRRLTLAQKGLFFEWKKAEVEALVYQNVGKQNVQFIHIYNGGNATVCFSEVEAAIQIKKVLKKMVREKARDGLFGDLHISFSKDPCETELRFPTQMVEYENDE